MTVAAASLARELAGATGLQLEWVPEIDSTSSELMRRARAGAAAPAVLVADRQTQGRGRMGRGWESRQAMHDAESLTFSIGMPLAPRDWSGLSLAVGVCVAESIDPQREAPVLLKWPNDLWIEDRKLGGILVETALPHNDALARYLVVGIGLNLDLPAPSGAMRTPPAAIRQFAPGATADGLLRDIVPPLYAGLQRFAERGFAAFAERFTARDALAGREIALSDGRSGRYAGVGWGGELLLQAADGLHTVSSAEISVRPGGTP